MKNKKISRASSTGYTLPKSLRKKGLIFCYLMIIPAILGMIKYIYINLDSILIAFTIEDATAASGQRLAWTNFIRLFDELRDSNSTIYIGLRNTFKYFILAVVKPLLSFGIAYFLYKKILGYKAFRTIFFLPSIVVPLILITVFKDLIAVYGPIWTILDKMGINFPNLLSNPNTATKTIIVYTFWQGFGATMLIFVGAMNRIPQEIVEAGELDGCNQIQEFFLLIVPLCWDSLSTMLVLAFTQIFMASGPILYFTAGAHNTTTLAYWIFDQVRYGSYNYPSAVGIFFTLVGIPFVFFFRWLLSKVNQDLSY